MSTRTLITVLLDALELYEQKMHVRLYADAFGHIVSTDDASLCSELKEWHGKQSAREQRAFADALTRTIVAKRLRLWNNAHLRGLARGIEVALSLERELGIH